MKGNSHRIIVKDLERFRIQHLVSKALQIQIAILLYPENLLEIQIMSL